MQRLNIARILLAHQADEEYGRKGELLEALRPFLQRLRVVVERLDLPDRNAYRSLNVNALSVSTGQDVWTIDMGPDYFFLDENEPPAGGPNGRVVRVRTHALTLGTIRGRLRQHRGPVHGHGSHRGSVFRLVSARR